MSQSLNKSVCKSLVKLKSFSKINLGLWIKEKRVDGFHEIETIFLENENLYDDILIEFNEDKNLSVKVNFDQSELNNLIPNEHNLAYKAAKVFCERLELNGNCTIKINKKIPIEAGLGGGSSNAAAVLKGLNEIFEYPLREKELLHLASILGSDVPFFIIGRTCLATGRGEILKLVENNLDLNIKVIKPDNVSISTKWAYEALDSREFITDRSEQIKNLLLALKTGDSELLFKNIFNDFEIVAFTSFPELIKLRQKLSDEGFKAVGLCGSGAAVFGVTKNI